MAEYFYFLFDHIQRTRSFCIYFTSAVEALLPVRSTIRKTSSSLSSGLSLALRVRLRSE